MKTDHEITEMIKREMELQGITQSQMAQTLGIATSTIHSRLNIHGSWPLDLLNRWGKVLGFEAQVVFVRRRNPPYLAHPKNGNGEDIVYPPLSIFGGYAELEEQLEIVERGERFAFAASGGSE